MSHEGQMQLWPDASVPPPAPKPVQKSRNPRGGGIGRRDRGCETALANEPDETFRDQGKRVARELRDSGRPWAMEELRDLVTIKPHHPNCWGALMREVRRLPGLRVVGKKKHEFTKSNGREIPIYQGIKVQEGNGWRN